ncbi:MAG: DUF4290 domain-containing protein [Bacteroidaceae bacterium]|nr:DUF4290 domain-containing protein [Bacteroidaceae bacterium]
MNYNTQREKLPMPEYGRAVQDMVDYAVTIEDRKERESCARSIIAIMGSMFPALRDVPDFQGKLWDHLAFMSDYKLDIDYPYPITKLEKERQLPDTIGYPAGDIRFRHYGRIIPEMLDVAASLPEGPERNQLLHLTAVQMKKDLMLWNKEMVDDARIASDIDWYSKGKLRLQEGELDVTFSSAPHQQRQQQYGKKKNKRRY